MVFGSNSLNLKLEMLKLKLKGLEKIAPKNLRALDWPPSLCSTGKKRPVDPPEKLIQGFD